MLAFLLAGCAILQVREDVETLHQSTVLVGIVSSPTSNPDMPVVVAAYARTDTERAIVHYTTLHEPGPYELMAPAGTHNIVAFGDKNRNLTYDRGEPAGQVLGAEQVSAPAGGVSGHLDIVLSDQDSDQIDLPVGTPMPPKGYDGFHSTAPGAIADLDDYLFSDEYGNKGYWASVDFFREVGGNVYFLEPYDPEKIPILFVHGVTGSPQNWRTFFEGIDRSRYQPWFFYYPSGSSIDSMSHLLFWKLQNLQTKYQFKELHITAHSMGGLVVRSFLVNYGPLFPSITNFVSISTPWGGEELAEIGVQYSPGVIPAWIDMQPGSKLLNSIFSRHLPPGVDYYLFFGHKGNRNVFRPNNDNAVTLASQLDPRSQQDAKMIYGFNEDHVSILSSDQVIAQYNAILADTYQRSKAAEATPGNRLRVEYSFDYPRSRPRPETALYIHSVDRENGDTWVYLSPEDTGRVHGPFPSGKYEVSIIAPAFVPEPVRVPVRIEEGMIPSVEFSMKPVGYIRGIVVRNEEPGIQAGGNRQPDTEVEIESITLRGNGIHRTLMPLQTTEYGWAELYPEHYLSQNDYSSQGTFFFFGLPSGKYDLILKAKGYEPYTRTWDVEAGEYQNSLIVQLIKTPPDSP